MTSYAAVFRFLRVCSRTIGWNALVGACSQPLLTFRRSLWNIDIGESLGAIGCNDGQHSDEEYDCEESVRQVSLECGTTTDEVEGATGEELTYCR